MKRFVFVILFALSFALPASAVSITGLDENLPVDVAADRMVYETEKNSVTFQGGVEAVRGEFTLWSDILTLYLKSPEDKEKKNATRADSAMGEGDLERIVAEKNVRFKNGTQTGSAKKATYFAEQGLLILEGEPVLHDGENSIRGKVIRYYTKEERSVVEGGPKERVHAVFSSKKKGN